MALNKNFSMNLNFENHKDKVYACWLGRIPFSS